MNKLFYSAGKQKVNFQIAGIIIVSLAAFCLSGCRLYNLEKKLPSKYQEFLSEVRYIISSKERKIFLELPASERDSFIEEFWKRRDPLPETPVNEFKIEYENRIIRANEIFRSEGKAGWLTDRGRIYVLFGPPMERLTYPVDATGNCREIWYYGNFPVIFIDEFCSGHYTLTAINLEHLQDLNIAQGYFQTVHHPQQRLFDYRLNARDVRRAEQTIEGFIDIIIPYSAIWFSLKEGQLETSFEVAAEIFSGSQKLWQSEASFPLSMSEEELKENRDKDYIMTLPFSFNIEKIGSKIHELIIRTIVKNTTEKVELKKESKFVLKS